MTVSKEKKQVQKIMDQIRKLWALAGNNPNANERARAMEMADELLIKYNIDKSKIKCEDNSSEISHFVTDIPSSYASEEIGMGIGLLHFCQAYRSAGKLAFIGTEVNREVCSNMTLWILTIIQKEARDEFFEAEDQQAFIDAAAAEVNTTCWIMYQSRKTILPGGQGHGNALMVLDKDLQKQNTAYATDVLKMGFGSMHSARYTEASSAGKEYGGTINPGAQVGGKAAPKRLG